MTDREQFRGVRVLIFDLDGTLIDSKRDLANAVNATREQMGMGALPEELIFSFVGNGAPMLIRRSLGEGATEENIERALVFFLAYYKEHALDTTVPYPGVKEGLEHLDRHADMGMAVLTNKPVRISKAILEGLGLSPHFRYVYGGNSFERKKPDPIGVEVLLRDFGVAPREAMMVGDTDVDVQTARNAGIWACGVTYGLGPERLVETAPDLIVGSLTDLPMYLGSAEL